MAKLFLDGIFNDGNVSPSSIIITIPNASSKPKKADRFTKLTGLMIGDPTWGAANKWGTIINDISNLTDISSLVGSDSMFSWINASTMCWKGTAPLSIGVEFFLINYKEGLGLENKLRSFMKLASLYQDPDATAGANYKVLVHGGYSADVLTGNKKLFDSVKDIEGLKDHAASSAAGALYGGRADAKGAVQLQFGHKSKISNLLLTKINVTESTVEVASADGSNPKPLYYRVSAQFTGVKPLLTVDIDRMFAGGSTSAGAGGFWTPSESSGGNRGNNIFGSFIPT